MLKHSLLYDVYSTTNYTITKEIFFVLEAFMFGKKKKLANGSGVLASERLKGTMHDQRKLLDFEEQRRVSRIESELEILRAMKHNAELQKSPISAEVAVTSNYEQAFDRVVTPVGQGDDFEFDLPSGWSAPSNDDHSSLRARFDEEERGLLGLSRDTQPQVPVDGFDLESPLRHHMMMLGSFTSSLKVPSPTPTDVVVDTNEDFPVEQNKPAQKREMFMNRSAKGPGLKADAGLGVYDFGLGEVVSGAVKTQASRQPTEVSLVEHIQRRESLRMDMQATAESIPSAGGQAASMLSANGHRELSKPEVTLAESAAPLQEEVGYASPSMEFDEAFSKKIELLESNLSSSPPELDPYDLDFQVEATQMVDSSDADDSIPVLTDIIAEGKPSSSGVMKTKYGATQSVSVLSLLYSWAFSLSSGKRSVAVVKSLEILNDPHQPNDLEYFSAPDFHGQLWTHSLGKLNPAPSSFFSAAGIFHIFRPKLLPSEERGRFSLMTRDPGSEPFFKWFTPVSPKSSETCVDSFAHFTLDKISRSLGARIQILWDAARALKSLDLEASPSLRNDVRVMTKVYELTGSMLTPSLLHSLSQSMPDSGMSLQSWLLTHESSKSIDWVEVPWGDHPVEIILFHLLGQIAADKRMSLSSLRILALLDSMLVNTDKMSRYTDSEISVCAVYESHERSCALENPPSDKNTFVGKHLHLIDSEKLDSKLYENPMLEISRCDDRSYVSGPFLKTIIERFSSMHEKLVEVGLIRPELLVLSQKMQQID